MSAALQPRERTRTILLELYRRRVETRDWLAGRFFVAAADPREAARCTLGRMASQGLVARTPYLERASGMRVGAFAIDQRGVEVLRRAGLASATRTPRRLQLAPAVREHQVVTNHLLDGLLAHTEGLERRYEHLELRRREQHQAPDGVLRLAEARGGRDLVLLETDLGHYRREPLMAKVRALLEAEDTAEVWTAVPDERRREEVARWHAEQFGGMPADARVHTHAEVAEGRVASMLVGRQKAVGALDAGGASVGSEADSAEFERLAWADVVG